MRNRFYVPVTLIVLGAVGLRVAGATQAPPPQMRGSQPTYFIEHPEHIPIGLSQVSNRWMTLKNPYEGDATRVAEGAKLFIAYNCMDCHGADGSGAMGPSFQDGRWHFGGTAGEVFQSIFEGRPDGMPAWGGRIGDDQIWRLVAYLQTLPKGHSVATENFTGKTIARSGH